MSKEIMLHNIEKAQCAIDKNKEAVKNGKMRQRYHFMGETGWINDPNGLIYYKGKYHFFSSLIRITGTGIICIGGMR